MNARDRKVAPAGDESLAGQAEVVLLTVDGADFRRVGVEAQGGVITLSGEVKTESERKQAAAVVGRVDGVHEVNNELRVAHEALGRSPDLAAVNQIGTARLSGKTTQKVRAVAAYAAEKPAHILEKGKVQL